MINSLILKYGKMDLDELLNFVYFYTEPMMYAKPKNRLDFSLAVIREEKQEITFNLNKKTVQKIHVLQKRLNTALSKIPNKDFQSSFVSEDTFEDSDIIRN